MKTVFCPNCGKCIEVEKDDEVAECTGCGEMFDVEQSEVVNG
jgi:DNA-directed RNA polymerase subunit M/transcription elongation factor TFIIS